MIRRHSWKFSVIAFVFFISACSSGRKLLEKGDYDAAVYTAINRLKNNPNKSKAVQTLRDGYDFAYNRHLKNIEEIKISSNLFKWEGVVREYQALNSLSRAIEDCPACFQAVPDTERFISEFEEAKYKAAEDRYAAGLKAINQGSRESARAAYEHFDRANQLYPDFKDSHQMMDEAYQMAVLKVIVEPVRVNSRLYKLSNDFFQNKISEFMMQYEDRSFVKFYTPEEAQKIKLVAHQILSLNFDDFVVGQTYVKEQIKEVKKDSVLIGETRTKTPVYGTVKANVITYEKSITSSGLLDLTIREYNTGKVISQEKMPGTFIWTDVWGTFKGDERALTKEEERICKRRESLPPAPQDLFLEFTKPIYSQVVSKVRNFYSRY